MASIFTKIIRGEIPCYKIAETEDYFAFLDISPLSKGHTLAIPKVEVDYLFDLKEDQYVGLHLFAREVARAIKAVVPCKRIGTAVIGLEVPHAHIHLVPINQIDDLRFDRPRIDMSPEEMTTLAKEIRSHLL